MALAARKPTRDTARAMSQENVEIVARFYPDSSVDIPKLFSDDDAMTRYEAPLLPLFHPSFEVILDPGYAGLSDTTSERNLRGIDAFREMWRDWLSAWESFRLDVEDLLSLVDSRVLALVVVHARPKAGGIEMSLRAAAIWTLIDGQVSRIQLFLDRDEALEAAGLRE
jgi:ketosteroid isomerase-like protein